MSRLFLNYLAFVLLFSTAALAQIPKTMSYQGVLTDTSGNAVADGNYDLTFRIYISGGTEIWMETQTIPVADGIFNTILGSVTALNLPFDQPYWMSISVEGGAELSPRIELTSAPYSLEPDSGSGGDGHSLDAADGDPVDALYVDNDGKVGIGTTIPNETLVVGNSTDMINQNIRVKSQKDVALILEADTDNASEIDNPYISFLQDGSIVEGIIGMSGGAGVGPDGSQMTDVGANSLVLANKFAGARVQFMTNNGTDVGNRMTINGDGQVGIGTFTPYPNSQLNVVSSNAINGVVRAEYTGPDAAIAVVGSSPEGQGGLFGGEYNGITGYAINDAGSGFGVRGSAENGGIAYGVYGEGFGGSVNNYAVYAAGNLAYTGNLINASDAKLKENIHPLTGSLDKLMRLKPKTFNFTSDEIYAHMNLPEGEHYGLVAQEVEPVLPELVSDNSHPSAAESRGEKSDDPPITYKGLNSMEFIPILIEAVKEQQTIIEKQQEEINQLRLEVNQLKNN